MTLRGVEIDTHLECRDEAIKLKVAPQAFQILDLHSPMMTIDPKGSLSFIQPPFFHEANRQLYNLDTKGRHHRQPKTTNRRTQTPKQEVHGQNPTSTGTPSSSE
jgi:hypothetical protein